jgi:hypothetical protein
VAALRALDRPVAMAEGWPVAAPASRAAAGWSATPAGLAPLARGAHGVLAGAVG